MQIECLAKIRRQSKRRRSHLQLPAPNVADLLNKRLISSHNWGVSSLCIRICVTMVCDPYSIRPHAGAMLVAATSPTHEPCQVTVCTMKRFFKSHNLPSVNVSCKVD